jgi:DNA polymerase-3 subunit alpha
VEDALDVCGLSLLPPDINLSEYRFTPVGEPGRKATQIRYGLGAVKGSGQSAIEAIVAARQEKPFTDLFDFAKRVDKKQINRRTVDSLIRAGAFDSFGSDRAILLASVGLAMDSAEQAERSANQVSLFGGDDSDLETPLTYVNVPPWSEKQRLTEEKTALGFYLSGHLFTAYEPEVRKFARTRLSSLEPSREPRMIAGIIVAVRTQMTQRGKIVIVTLDDASSTADVTVYNELYEPNRAMFKEDELLVVQGKVSEDRFSGGMRVSAEKVMDIGAARAQYGKQFSVASSTGFDTGQLKNILSQYRSDNGLPFVMQYTHDGVSCEVRWPAAWQVKPADELKLALMDKLGVQNATIEYS